MSICMLRTCADPLACRSNAMRSMPLGLHAKGSASVRNIQIKPNLTKQKCPFVCYGQVQILWRVDPMACFALMVLLGLSPKIPIFIRTLFDWKWKSGESPNNSNPMCEHTFVGFNLRPLHRSEERLVVKMLWAFRRFLKMRIVNSLMCLLQEPFHFHCCIAIRNKESLMTESDLAQSATNIINFTSIWF